VLLCVDVGNTHIALGLYPAEGGPGPDEVGVPTPAPLRDWRLRTDPRTTADELGLAVDGMLGEHAGRVTAVAALSTVPGMLRELRQLIDRRGLPSIVVGPGVRTGMPLLVDNPREVGADRVVNTLAAHRRFGTACVVADLGTATNVDVVSAKGEFLGGAILPGVDIALDALAERAATLRPVELARPRSVIGRTTVECVQSGMLYGYAAQVDGLVRRIVAELGPAAGPVTVVGTGWSAPLLAGISETVTEHLPDLTLAGLRLTWLRSTTPTGRGTGAVRAPR
jgi:type III pantothenate kinase